MSSNLVDQRKRGRPRGFDETSALEAAMMVFWRNGFAGTSLDDLVEATGASRAGLYATFGDKVAIFRQSLVLYGLRFTDRIDAVLKNDGSGLDRMKSILQTSADRLTSGNAPPGCLRCNSTLELMGTDNVFDELLDEANDAFLQNILRLIEQAAVDGEIRKGRKGGLALFYTCIVDGMVTMAKAGASRADLDRVIATAMGAWPDPPRDD